MGMNSLLPRLNIKSSSTNGSSGQPLRSGGRVKYSHEQFIPRDGIDEDVLTTYLAQHYGDNVDWRAAVNSADGKEGYLLKSTVPLGPDDINILRQYTSEQRKHEQQCYREKFFEQLHQNWVQHREYLEHEADIQAANSIPTQRIDRNLPVPFLDLPPKYNDIEGLHSHWNSIGIIHHQSTRLTVNANLGTGQSHRQRPVSCPPMSLSSPTGGYYGNGFNGPQGLEGTGAAFSRINGPLGLPEFHPGNDSIHNVISPVKSTEAPSRLSIQVPTLGRARSTTSLRSQHWGLVHRPSQRMGGSDELFFGNPNLQ